MDHSVRDRTSIKWLDGYQRQLLIVLCSVDGLLEVLDVTQLDDFIKCMRRIHDFVVWRIFSEPQ